MNKRILAFSVFLFVSSWLYAQDNSVGEITWVEGSARVEYPSKNPEDAKIGTPLMMNATLSTGENSKVVVKLSDGTILSIAPKTKIFIESLIKTQDKREASVLTFVGKVRAVVKKQVNSKSKFEFRSKTAIAGVRGTHLALDVAEDGTTRVFLINGFAGVFSRDKMDLPEIMLSEGTFSEIREGAAPTPPQPIPPDVLQDIYRNTSIMAMLKNELNKSVEKGSGILPDTKTLSGTLEENLIIAIREKEKEEISRRSAYSQSLTEPLREQDIQGVVTPRDFTGEVNTKRVDVNIFIDVNNY
ncbi:MAG: FecR family protein [Deltaproteobacteria bacterium]|nr:FecR family protein [Deltaproteobacteria bacterium]